MNQIRALRYAVIPYHGEARSIFHVVDNYVPEDEQPSVVSSHPTREAAESERWILEIEWRRELDEILRELETLPILTALSGKE